MNDIPSYSQAALSGRISKPSVELLTVGKVKSSLPSLQQDNITWSTRKRKRNEDHLEAQNSRPPVVLPHIKLKPRSHRSPALASKRFSAGDKSHGPIESALEAKATCVSVKPRLSLVFHSLSKPARSLITLHKLFLRAFSLHCAHNGPQAPADLSKLLETVTALRKEYSVTQDDLQKMFAISEIRVENAQRQGQMIAHCSSPFKVVTAGSSVKVQFSGQLKPVKGPMSTVFNEEDLHQAFKSHIYALNSVWVRQQLPSLSFFDDETLHGFPKLVVEVERQSANGRIHLSQQRANILALSNAARTRDSDSSNQASGLNHKDKSNQLGAVESRRQSLLDRIQQRHITGKAKENSTQQILRRHSLDRIEEVTEILRMMQQQRTSGEQSKPLDVSSGHRARQEQTTKVSFSLYQLLVGIKSSVRVPISDEEVRMCLRMLSGEFEGDWVKWIESKGTGIGTTGVVVVVLVGEGLNGKETYKRLVEKQI